MLYLFSPHIHIENKKYLYSYLTLFYSFILVLLRVKHNWYLYKSPAIVIITIVFANELIQTNVVKATLRLNIKVLSSSINTLCVEEEEEGKEKEREVLA